MVRGDLGTSGTLHKRGRLKLEVTVLLSAQVSHNRRFKARHVGRWAVAATAIATWLWLLVLLPAGLEAQVLVGPSVSRVSPSGYGLSLNNGVTQQFTVRATAGSRSISGWEWFVDDVSQGGQSLALTESIDRTFSYTFSSTGVYRVKATFTDTDSRSGSTSWQVTVSDSTQPNRAPTITRVSPPSPVSLTTDDSQTFSASATDPDNNISEWEWYLDDESQGGQLLELTGSISRSVSYTFSTAGTYTVEVEFTDLDLESDSFSWTVSGIRPASGEPASHDYRGIAITSRVPDHRSQPDLRDHSQRSRRQSGQVRMVRETASPGTGGPFADRPGDAEIHPHLFRSGQLHGDGHLH